MQNVPNAFMKPKSVTQFCFLVSRSFFEHVVDDVDLIPHPALSKT